MGAGANGISMSQIASYWISAHSKDNCQTAVAVAMAESRGDCNAQYVNGPGSIDRGLWQINSKYHPECSDSCAYSCSCNAGCAVNVWKSRRRRDARERQSCWQGFRDMLSRLAMMRVSS